MGHAATRPSTATALAIAVLISSCGGSDRGDMLPSPQQRALPLDEGALNQLCAKLPEQWRDPEYQSLRRLRLRQADALIRALRAHPNAKMRAHFTDADSGREITETLSVRDLAREDLHLYDGARYCSRPDSATPRAPARAGLVRIRLIRTLASAHSAR
jgi:hypothetical protein